MHRRLCLCAIGALCCVVIPLRAQPNVTAPQSAYSYEQRLGTQISPDLLFRDETGRDVRLGDYFGKRPLILVIIQYRCRMLCNEVLNGLVASLRALPGNVGDQFDVLTISFDDRETPELAAAKKTTYIEEYGRPYVAEGWHFLTGDKQAVHDLTEAVGFQYAYSPKQDVFAHPSGLVVLTPDGKTSAYLDGIEFPPDQLQARLVNAAEGKIGRPVPSYWRRLMLCYDYDPATGGYSLNIMRAVRLGGALTVFVLGGVLVTTWWRSRRAAT
ncbi:MAG TPA: SCO family protein [Gemmataceae bacterium]